MSIWKRIYGRCVVRIKKYIIDGIWKLSNIKINNLLFIKKYNTFILQLWVQWLKIENRNNKFKKILYYERYYRF